MGERPAVAALPLVAATDPVLRKRARELSDRERARVADGLIERLFAAMKATNGAGLAAPQIGESLRVFVAGRDSFVNPVITDRSAETDVQEEGCLSLPGVLVPVRRNLRVTVQTAGRRVVLEGIAARVAQHEIDHLDGKLITDYVSGAALEAPPHQSAAELGKWFGFEEPSEAQQAANLAHNLRGEAPPKLTARAAFLLINLRAQTTGEAFELAVALENELRVRGEAGPLPPSDEFSLAHEAEAGRGVVPAPPPPEQIITIDGAGRVVQRKSTVLDEPMG